MHGDKFHQGVPTDHWHKFQNPDIAYMAGLAKATRATMWSGTIRGVSVSVASTASPQTITLPATTLAGDCLVIAASCGGSYTPSGSGAGATWNTVVSSGTAPKAYLVVGWGCTAGNTTCVLTGFSNSGSVVLTQFTGVLSSSNPVQGTQVTQWSSATGGTTASLSYTAGSLLIAVSSQYTGSPPPTITWSNGDANTNAQYANYGARPCSLDYASDTSSTSSTCQVAWGNTNSGGIVFAALTPAVTPPTNTNLLAFC